MEGTIWRFEQMEPAVNNQGLHGLTYQHMSRRDFYITNL